MDIIRSYVFYSQGICVLLSFLLSLRLIRNDYIPNYMKTFHWYPIVGVITGIPIYFPIVNLDIVFSINNCSLIFHYSFLSLFIIRVMPSQSKKIYYLIFLIVLIILLYGLFSNDITEPLHRLFAISSLALTFFCLLYFYQIFNSAPILNLLNEPCFWIVCGTFFSMSLYMPMGLIANFLRIHLSYDYFVIFGNIFMFCYLIMQVFFIKAILCATQSHRQ